MALALNQLDAVTSSSNTSSYTGTAGITPSANALILVTLVWSKASTPDLPSSVAGYGITFTKVANDQLFSTIASPTKRVAMYRGLAASPTNAQLTVTFPASQTGCAIVVDEITGVDTSGTNGNGALAQSAKNAGDAIAAAGTLTATLGALRDSNSAAYIGAGSSTNVAALSPEAGWTQSRDQGYNTPVTGIYAGYRLGTTDNTATVTIDTATKDVGMVAVEVLPPLSIAPGFINQGATTFAPSVAMAVAPGFIDQTPQTFAPIVVTGAQVAPPFITQAVQMFSPAVAFAVAPGVITQAVQMFTPAVRLTVAPGFISVAPQLFAPSVRLAVAPGSISVPPQMFAPAVRLAVLPGSITQPVQTFAPSVAFKVAPAVIIVAPQLFAPAVREGLGVPFISQVPVLSAPAVAFVVTVPAITQTPVLFVPVVNVTIGPVLVLAPFIAQLGVVYVPVVQVPEQPLPPMYDPSIDGRRPRRRDSLSNPRRAVHRKGVR